MPDLFITRRADELADPETGLDEDEFEARPDDTIGAIVAGVLLAICVVELIVAAVLP